MVVALGRHVYIHEINEESRNGWFFVKSTKILKWKKEKSFQKCCQDNEIDCFLALCTQILL